MTLTTLLHDGLPSAWIIIWFLYYFICLCTNSEAKITEINLFPGQLASHIYSHVIIFIFISTGQCSEVNTWSCCQWRQARQCGASGTCRPAGTASLSLPFHFFTSPPFPIFPPLLSHPSPYLPFPSLPISNLVHLSRKIRNLVATILMIFLFLRINWWNFVQCKQ